MWDGILLYVIGVNIVMLELLEVLELLVLVGIISYVLDAFLVPAGVAGVGIIGYVLDVFFMLLELLIRWSCWSCVLDASWNY